MSEQATAIQKKQEHPVTTFQAYFNARRGALGGVLPKVLNLDRVMKVALAAYARTPGLWECSLESVYQAINQSVQLGLEPGSPLGHAYLVPYKTSCTLIVGYKGLIALARRSGEISTIEAHVVHENDKFDVKFGSDSRIVHEPDFKTEDPGEAVLVYAVATLRDGTKQCEVMGIREVNKIRDRSPGAKTGKSPWTTDYEEMARKTAVRRLCKYLPMSVELANALEVEPDEKHAGADLTLLAAATVVDDGSSQQTVQSDTSQAQTASEKGELRAKSEKPAEKRSTAQTTAVGQKIVDLLKAAKTLDDIEAAMGEANQHLGLFNRADSDAVGAAKRDAETRLDA